MERLLQTQAGWDSETLACAWSGNLGFPSPTHLLYCHTWMACLTPPRNILPMTCPCFWQVPGSLGEPSPLWGHTDVPGSSVYRQILTFLTSDSAPSTNC